MARVEERLVLTRKVLKAALERADLAKCEET
jgi:hypothetical protein